MVDERPIADLVLHPVRLKIIQQVGGRNMTTGELRKALPDVTQATLYRHVAALLEADILTVVDERQIRGAIERTLALGERMAHVGHDELQAMDSMQLGAAFATFLSGLSDDFDQLLADERTELRGSLGFSRAPIYLDTQDLGELQASLMEVLTPYLQRSKAGQRRLNLATILIPDTDDNN